MDVYCDDELLQIWSFALGGDVSRAELEELVYGDSKREQVGNSAPPQRG